MKKYGKILLGGKCPFFRIKTCPDKKKLVRTPCFGPGSQCPCVFFCLHNFLAIRPLICCLINHNQSHKTFKQVTKHFTEMSSFKV